MRLKSLDVLRAVAVLLVLGRHFEIVKWWYMAGWTGVNLFFVLSGFLISGLLFSEFKTYSRIRVGHFLVRRGFKIYPPFYFMIGFSLAMILAYHRPIPWPRFFGEFFFLQNYYNQFWGPTWSLAVEEHFYLALPVLLILLARFSRGSSDPFRALPAIFLAVGVAVLAARFWICPADPVTITGRLFQTQYQMDSLLFGVVIAYFFHFRASLFAKISRWKRPWVAVASLLCIAPSVFLDFYNSYFMQTTGHVLLYLGFGGMVMLAVTRPETGVRRLPGVFRSAGDQLALVGRHSYSIYLWHQPVASWGLDFLHRKGHLPANHAAQFLIYFAGSLTMGIALSKIVEYPALKLRDKLFPSRSGILTNASPHMAGAAATVAGGGDLIPATVPPLFEKG